MAVEELPARQDLLIRLKYGLLTPPSRWKNWQSLSDVPGAFNPVHSHTQSKEWNAALHRKLTELAAKAEADPDSLSRVERAVLVLMGEPTAFPPDLLEGATRNGLFSNGEIANFFGVTSTTLRTRIVAAEERLRAAGIMPQLQQSWAVRAGYTANSPVDSTWGSRGSSTPLESVDLAVRVREYLLAAGLKTVEEVASKTEQELLRTPGIAPKSIQAIKEMLARRGLSLATGPLPEPAATSPRNPAAEMTPLSEAGLSTRALRTLTNDGNITLGDVAGKTEAELRRTPELGRKQLIEVKRVLADFGLSLRAS